MKKRALSDLLSQYALNSADAAPHLVRDDPIASALPVQLADLFLLLLANGGSTKLNPMSLGSSHPCFDPLLDHGAFKLGEHTQHLEQRFAGWRSRINRLPVQVQINTRA